MAKEDVHRDLEDNHPLYSWREERFTRSYKPDVDATEIDNQRWLQVNNRVRGVIEIDGDDDAYTEKKLGEVKDKLESKIHIV